MDKEICKDCHVIEILTAKSPIERLALAIRYYPKCKNMTHQQLGDFVNLNRETVTRTFLKIRNMPKTILK